MKILLIHNYYRSIFKGGEDIAFKDEVKFLQRTIGEENVIVYTDSSDRMNILNLIANVFFSIKHFKNVLHLIRKNRIDIVHCHNFFPLISFSVFLAAKISKVKTILTLHNYRIWCPSGLFFRENSICLKCLKKSFAYPSIRYSCYHESKFQSLVISIVFFINKKLIGLNRIDYFFTLTEFQKNFLIKNQLIEPKKIFVKPNILDLPETDKNIIKKFDFIFIGRLSRSQGKGLYTFINSFIEELKSNTLLIIGNGELETKYSRYKNIIHYQNVERKKVFKFIQESKFLIQSSIWFETFGLTIIEAMSAGVPVLGYPIGTRKNFITDGKNGFFLDPNNPKLILRKAISLDDTDYSKMSQNSIEFSTKYHAEKTITEQVNIYKKITQASN